MIISKFNNDQVILTHYQNEINSMCVTNCFDWVNIYFLIHSPNQVAIMHLYWFKNMIHAINNIEQFLVNKIIIMFREQIV